MTIQDTVMCICLNTNPKDLMLLKYSKRKLENQLNKKIKILRTDHGGEYTSGILDDFCKENGIVHHYTLPYTPQQNGVAERRNRILMDMVRSMMAYSDLPLSFWGEALHTVVYLLNHSPSKSVSSTLWIVELSSVGMQCTD